MAIQPDMSGNMSLMHHSIGIVEFFQGAYIMLAIVMISGFLICASIAFIACFINKKRNGSKIQEGSEDSEAE